MTQTADRLAERLDSTYPYTTATTSIHFTPVDCYVRRPFVKQTTQLHTLLQDELWLVNQDAARLLAACDGTRSVRDVLIAFDVGYNEPEVINVCGFLAEAFRRGDIQFSDSPLAVEKPRVTGSTEFYVPIHISVEVSSRCNLACPYCYNEYNKDDELDMNLEEISTILDTWYDLGLSSLEITGGEPFLHPEIYGILEYTINKFRSVALLTNGLLVDEKVVEYLKKWKDRLLISISIDGPDAETHDAMTATGAFDKACTAVRLLAEQGFMVRVAMTATPETVFKIEETLLLAKKLGARYFGYTPVAPFGRGIDLAWEWKSADAPAISAMEVELAREYAGFLTVVEEHHLNFNGAQVNCGAGHKNLVLSPRGKVRTCLFEAESRSIGDLRNETLEQILRKPVLAYMRDLAKPQLENCNGCRYQLYCAGCVIRPLAVFPREGRLCYWGHENNVQDWLGVDRSLKYDPERPVFA